jgi:hypothetical protein
VVRLASPVPVAFHGFELHPDDPDDPYVFRIDASELGLGTGRLIFAPSATGRTRVLIDMMPISLRRRPPRSHRGRWVAAGIGAGALAAAFVAGRRGRSTLARANLRRNP